MQTEGKKRLEVSRTVFCFNATLPMACYEVWQGVGIRVYRAGGVAVELPYTGELREGNLVARQHGREGAAYLGLAVPVSDGPWNK